jgi:hypothetical protein
MQEAPKYIVMSGVGPEHPKDAPENWHYAPCWDKHDVKELVRDAEANGAETVKVFRLVDIGLPH